MRVKGKHKFVQALGLLLSALAVSVTVYNCLSDLRQAVLTVESLFSVTILATQATAELQFSLQESQRQYSYAVEAADFRTRSEYISRVRASDQKVSLLQGKMALLPVSGTEHGPITRFWADWEPYTDARDTGLAHVLQGKTLTASESKEINKKFEQLTYDVHVIEEQFQTVASGEARQVRHSLILAGYELAGTLVASALFLLGLIGNTRAKKRALRLLLEKNSELEQTRRFEQDRSRIMEEIGSNKGLDSIIQSVVRLVETRLPSSVCSIALLDDLSRFGTVQQQNVPENATQPGYCIPVLSSIGLRLGAVTIYPQQPGALDEKQLSLLHEAVQLTALAAEQRSLFEQLTHQARVDHLTQLPNRLLLQDRLQNCMSAAQASSQPFAVLWVDLDRFKQVNDTLGHRIGDLVLRHAAHVLTDAVSPGATVARIGGDEYNLLLPGCGEEAAAAIAAKIVSSLNQPAVLGEHRLTLAASVGISVFPNHGPDLIALVRNADAAMYEAKRRGGNRFLCFTKELADQSERHAQLIHHLRSALENKEFEVHYQPQSNAGGELVGFEALLRWNSPVMGPVPPSEFIPAAEEAGLIGAIGNWVMREACAASMRWMRSEDRTFTIAVNVSCLQLAMEDFARNVETLLHSVGLRPQFLELEITESVLMRNTAESGKQIERLRNMGVRLSIDDFGTGYSSLSYLQHLRVDAVKIDRSFVSELDCGNGNAVSLVQAIVAMAQQLGLKTVAEGVETEGQRKILRGIGCDFLQGYLIQRPMPSSDVLGYLRLNEDRQIAA